MQRYPASVWRRYDKLTRFPKGFLVMGDAVCSFNPVYGQGMTSAALQATALRRCLSDGTEELSLRFFRASAQKRSPIWWGNRFFDFTIIPSGNRQSKLKKLVKLGMDKVYTGAATDVAIAEMIFRQMQLLGQPTDILRPAMLRRVVASDRRQEAKQ